jgi:pimeloyl-ACP methyl ester carboxylesterase
MAVHYVHRATALPERLVRWPTLLALGEIERTTGLELSSVDPIAAAARVTCPTMVIHGESDKLVPIRFAPAVYEALAGPKEFWRVRRCGHCHHPDEPQALRRAEYASRWSEFFATHLPPTMGAKAKRKPRTGRIMPR